MPLALALLCLLFVAACGPTWVNPNISDPAMTDKILAHDKEYCRNRASQDVPYDSQQDRQQPLTSRTIDDEVDRDFRNYDESQRQYDDFDKCMMGMGWEMK